MSTPTHTITTPDVNFNVDDTDTVNRYGIGFLCMTRQGPIMWNNATSTISEGDYCNVVITAGVMSVVAATTTTVGSTISKAGMVANKAITNASYGWLYTGPFAQIQVNIAASITAGALTTTATAGVLGSGGTTVVGAALTTTTTSAALTMCSASSWLRTV